MEMATNARIVPRVMSRPLVSSSSACSTGFPVSPIPTSEFVFECLSIVSLIPARGPSMTDRDPKSLSGMISMKCMRPVTDVRYLVGRTKASPSGLSVSVSVSRSSSP